MIYISTSNRASNYNPKAYTYGFRVQIHPFNQLHTLTSTVSYSPMQFKNGHRLKDNVIGFTPLLILDADTDLEKGKVSYQIEELKLATKGISALITTTTSHTDEEHRLRLIVQLDKADGITVDNYHQVIHTLITALGLNPFYFDKACYYIDRQFAPNKNNQEHFYSIGKPIPIKFLLDNLVSIPIPHKHTKQTPFIAEKGKIDGSHYEIKQFMLYYASNEIATALLEDRGYRVDKQGKVFYDNSATTPLALRGNGVLTDWSTGDTSYSIIEVARRFINTDADLDTSKAFWSEPRALEILMPYYNTNATVLKRMNDVK